MASGDDFIDVDGSVLEGGGQIIRMAMVFSALLRKNVRISKIRAGRATGGLRPQHLNGLNLVRDLCNGLLNGGAVGSTEIAFYPKAIGGGEYLADPKTAGSVALLMQVSIPVALFANGPCKLTLRGGTNAEMAPQIDYILQVFKPMAERFGVRFECDVIRRGYYPKGGGEVLVTVHPVKSLTPVDILERGELANITGRSWVAGMLPVKISQTMAQVATGILKKRFPNVNINIETVKEPENAAFGNGAGIVIVGHTSNGCLLAGDALGKRGVPSEEVGTMAANALINNWDAGGCVDEHLQDQLIVFMALSSGISRLRTGPLTLHTKTAIYIAELLTEAKFQVKDAAGGACIIECQGIAYQNQQI